MLWYVNYISIKLLFKKMMREGPLLKARGPGPPADHIYFPTPAPSVSHRNTLWGGAGVPNTQRAAPAPAPGTQV